MTTVPVASSSGAVGVMSAWTTVVESRSADRNTVTTPAVPAMSTSSPGVTIVWSSVGTSITTWCELPDRLTIAVPSVTSSPTAARCAVTVVSAAMNTTDPSSTVPVGSTPRPSCQRSMAASVSLSNESSMVIGGVGVVSEVDEALLELAHIGSVVDTGFEGSPGRLGAVERNDRLAVDGVDHVAVGDRGADRCDRRDHLCHRFARGRRAATGRALPAGRSAQTAWCRPDPAAVAGRFRLRPRRRNGRRRRVRDRGGRVSSCPVSSCPVSSCPVSSCPVSWCPGWGRIRCRRGSSHRVWWWWSSSWVRRPGGTPAREPRRRRRCRRASRSPMRRTTPDQRVPRSLAADASVAESVGRWLGRGRGRRLALDAVQHGDALGFLDRAVDPLRAREVADGDRHRLEDRRGDDRRLDSRCRPTGRCASAAAAMHAIDNETSRIQRSLGRVVAVIVSSPLDVDGGCVAVR